MIRLIVGGQEVEAPDEATVESFIRGRGLDPKLVVVEHNGEPVARSRYDAVRLAEGDRLELVRAVAGG